MFYQPSARLNRSCLETVFSYRCAPAPYGPLDPTHSPGWPDTSVLASEQSTVLPATVQ